MEVIDLDAAKVVSLILDNTVIRNGCIFRDWTHLTDISEREFSVMGLSAVGFNVLNMLLGGATISVLRDWAFSLI